LALDKERNITKGIASAEQLGKLSRYVDRLLRQVALEISGGNIDADPCYYSEAENACTYCEFASACHFAAADETEQPRYVYPVKPEEFWNRISEQKGEEETHG
jgi:ATP-dependent helicase/nuclease subunit B